MRLHSENVQNTITEIIAKRKGHAAELEAVISDVRKAQANLRQLRHKLAAVKKDFEPIRDKDARVEAALSLCTESIRTIDEDINSIQEAPVSSPPPAWPPQTQAARHLSARLPSRISPFGPQL